MSVAGGLKILAVIPARAGSKSIPDKNIKLMCGKPLIAHSIEEARKSRHIQRVLVTTDSEKIAAISREYGADVPFIRPAHLAQDYVTDLPVFQHCLAWLQQHENYSADVVVHLRPTAPLRTAKHIDTGIQMLLDDPDLDNVRSVTPSGQHPLKMWRLVDNMLEPYIPVEVYGIAEAYNQPRQKLPQAFVQNGSVDVFWSRVVVLGNSMTGRRIKALVMEEDESINIDSALDWTLADRLMERRNMGGR